MTPLDKPLHRERMPSENACTLTLDPAGLDRVEKERRRGADVRWADPVPGDAAMAAALQASTATR